MPSRSIRSSRNTNPVLSFLFLLFLSLPLQWDGAHAQSSPSPAAGAHADLTGRIEGRILDATTKSPLVGATIRVVGRADGAITDGQGEFRINHLPEDVYKLAVSFVGYEPRLESDVRVVRGKSEFVTYEMVEAIREVGQVSVRAAAGADDRKAAASSYTYNREEINRSPGATGDIFRAIETLPGVSSTGGEFSAFSVRGGTPKDNIVLVDNIPTDRVSHFTGGSEEQEAQGGRFSIFAPNVIREARFQAGGFGARFGGKSASLVDMSIREGNPSTVTADGSYGLLGWEVNYNGPGYLTPGSGLLVSARHQDFVPVFKVIGTEQVGEPNFSDYIVKYTTPVSSSHRLSLLGIYSPEIFKREAKHIAKIDDDDISTELYYVDETKFVSGLNWRWLTSQRSYLQTTLYSKGLSTDNAFGRAYPSLTSDGKIDTSRPIPSRDTITTFNNDETESGLRLQYTYDATTHVTLRTGAELNLLTSNYTQRQFGDDTLYYFDRNDSRPDTSKYYLIRTPGQTNATFHEDALQGAAYVESTLPLDSATSIVPGLRVEYSRLNDRALVSPRFSLSHELGPQTRLNLAGGVYYQLPELRVIVQDKENRYLKAERSIHAIAGVTQFLGERYRLTVETYYKKFDDLIARPDRTNQRYANAGDGYAWGIDVSLLRRFVDHFYGQVNYSFAYARRDDHDGNGPYAPDFNQPHNFNILVGYQFNKAWSASAKWKYATGRPADNYIVHDNVLNDLTRYRYAKEITDNNGRREKDFHILNLRVDYRAQLGRVALVSFVDMLNLYGRKNVTRENFVDLTGKNIDDGFQFIPTIGMKLEI